jgi:hypothetical protein
MDVVVDNIATLEAALETAYHQHPGACRTNQRVLIPR